MSTSASRISPERDEARVVVVELLQDDGALPARPGSRIVFSMPTARCRYRGAAPGRSRADGLKVVGMHAAEIACLVE